ncbi:carbohydrate porin [Chitinimonas arctica]|uniref:Carbohydrate porin n=1 Tax=Chitinimonas arctica TaxID=2594795 RepID=A0A516SLN9_9NEIS|nr:carbohydrate porin [Chitinimonas arctica]QDQ29050.1 carbohydrate porin [Chitinimonas arctica]
MNRKTKLFAALFAAFTAQAAMAAAVDYHGYIRSGSGAASEGGREVCFGLAGAPAFGGKVASAGRLGNECETYGELSFDAKMGESDGMNFGFHQMLAFSTAQKGDWEEATPAWRQVWVEAGNIGTGALSKASLWAGKRFYKRHDVHIADFFWSANTGPGAGIENVDLGFGKFSYALMRNNGDDVKAVTNHDFRIEGIAANPGGSLEFGVNLVGKNAAKNAAGQKADGKNGFGFTVAHSQDNPFDLGGFNSVVFQYAKDAANLDQSAGFTGDSKKSWRVIEHLVFEPKDSNWNGAVFLGYGQEKYKDAKAAKTFTAIARPVYHFSQNYSLALEAGTTSVKPSAGDTQRISKLTIAPQLSMGKSFWARPVLRAYYTYAKWNDAAQKSALSQMSGATQKYPGGVAGGHDSAAAYANKTSGSSYGVQMEAWW